MISNSKNSFKSGYYFRIFTALVILCLLSGFSNKTLAQIVPISEPEVDSSYIELHYKEWSLRAFGAFRYHSIILKNDNLGYVRYRPDYPYSLGLGFAYRFVVIDVGIRLNYNDQLQRFDFNSSILFKQHLFELVLQRYEGFEESGKVLENQFRDDLTSSLFILNYLYNLKGKKLSLGSAISGNKIQKKSTGTALLGSFISYNHITADSSLVYSSDQGEFNHFANVVDSKMLNIGAYLGFAYTLVLPKNFFVFSTMNPGIGVNFANVNAIESYEPPVFPMWKLNARIAVGHYSKRIYTILGFNSNLSFIYLGHDNKFILNSGFIKLVVGYRFITQNKITATIDKTF